MMECFMATAVHAPLDSVLELMSNLTGETFERAIAPHDDPHGIDAFCRVHLAHPVGVLIAHVIDAYSGSGAEVQRRIPVLGHSAVGDIQQALVDVDACVRGGRPPDLLELSIECLLVRVHVPLSGSR
jgi:hypothetical protein